MQLDTALYIPFVIFALWIFTALMAKTFPTLTGKSIVILIAHPDDEAMFFAPTLLALSKPELGNHVKVLCFSSGTCSAHSLLFQVPNFPTGNADGLGDIRKNELVKSARLLGVRSD